MVATNRDEILARLSDLDPNGLVPLVNEVGKLNDVALDLPVPRVLPPEAAERGEWGNGRQAGCWLSNLIHHPGEPDGVSGTKPNSRIGQLNNFSRPNLAARQR